MWRTKEHITSGRRPRPNIQKRLAKSYIYAIVRPVLSWFMWQFCTIDLNTEQKTFGINSLSLGVHCEPQQWAASVLDHVSIATYKKHKSARTKEHERGSGRGRGVKSLTNTKLIENSTRRYTKTNRQRERKGNKTAFYNSFSCVQLRFGGSLTKLVPPKLTTLKRTLRNTQKILKIPNSSSSLVCNKNACLAIVNYYFYFFIEGFNVIVTMYGNEAERICMTTRRMLNVPLKSLRTRESGGSAAEAAGGIWIGYLRAASYARSHYPCRHSRAISSLCRSLCGPRSSAATRVTRERDSPSSGREAITNK